MLIVHFRTAFSNLKNHIHAHNAGKEKLADHIRQSSMSTAKDIICIYGLFLVKYSSLHPVDVKDLPPLRTNNVQLAKIGCTSPRTIQRHIHRLLEAGILLRKQWHGSNASYELWINPEILSIKPRKSLHDIKQGLETLLRENHEYDLKIMELERSTTTTCPHTDTGYNSYKLNNLLKPVDKLQLLGDILASGEVPGYDAGHTSERSSLALTANLRAGYIAGNAAGHTGEKRLHQKKLRQKKAHETGEKERDQRVREESADPAADPARAASLSRYVSLLWSLARNTLYRDRYLTPNQEELAQKLLLQWYQPVETRYLADVHQSYVERIGLVKKYVDKDPDRRYVQLPFRFFDPYNPSGFTATKKWYRLFLERKQEVHEKLILHNQVRRFMQNAQKAPDKQRSPYDLYRECEQRVGKLNQPELLDQFYAATLAPETWQQLHTSNYIRS